LQAVCSHAAARCCLHPFAAAHTAAGADLWCSPWLLLVLLSFFLPCSLSATQLSLALAEYLTSGVHTYFWGLFGLASALISTQRAYYYAIVNLGWLVRELQLVADVD